MGNITAQHLPEESVIGGEQDIGPPRFRASNVQRIERSITGSLKLLRTVDNVIVQPCRFGSMR